MMPPWGRSKGSRAGKRSGGQDAPTCTLSYCPCTSELAFVTIVCTHIVRLPLHQLLLAAQESLLYPADVVGNQDDC